MKEFLKIIGYAVGIGMIGTIIFVKAGQLGGENGGAQASNIISSTAKGAASVINATEGGGVS